MSLINDKTILCGIAVTERPDDGVIGFIEIPSAKARGEKFTLASVIALFTKHFKKHKYFPFSFHFLATVAKTGILF